MVQARGIVSWRLIVYAVCAVAPPGLTYVAAESQSPVNSSCPGDGLRLTGPGFRYSGYAAYGDGWLHTLRPDASLDSMYLHGRRDADSTADWWPELYPVCA